MAYFHKNLASGKWGELSLAEQLGNIGSEVSRALRSQNKDKKLFEGAAERALELFDLTLDDSRWRYRLRELARAREVFCDAAWNQGREYKSSLTDLNRYFFHFAFAARKRLQEGEG